MGTMSVLVVVATAVVVGALVATSGVNAKCPSGTGEHFSSSLAHPRNNVFGEGAALNQGQQRNNAHRPHRHRHCVCAPGEVCTGPLCSSAHENCTTPASEQESVAAACTLVHGFLESCSECKCIAATSVDFQAPQQLFLSMVGRGSSLSFNFAIHGKISRPHITVWRPAQSDLARGRNEAEKHPQEHAGRSLKAAAKHQHTTGPASFHTTAVPHQHINSAAGADAEQVDDEPQFLPTTGAVEVVAQQREASSEKALGITFWIAVLHHVEGEQLCYRAWNGDAHTATACTHVPTRSFPASNSTGDDQGDDKSGSHEASGDKGGGRLATVAIVGDIGMSYSAPLVMHALKHDHTLDILVHPGDVSYAFKVQEMNLYLSRLQGLVNHIPYQVCLGNHEANNARVLSAFNERFPTDMLAAASGSDSAHWFSFDAFGIHFVVLDSQNKVGPGSKQHTWLKQDLKAAAAAKARARQQAAAGAGAEGGDGPVDVRWIAVVMHYPLYSTHRRKTAQERVDKFSQMETLRQGLEPVLHQYGVDLVFAGHDHVYERTAHVLNATSVEAKSGEGEQPPGPAYIVVGTGGHNIYESWYNLPPYDVVRRAVPGYGRLVVNRNSTLTWEFVEVDISPCTRADYGGDKDCPQHTLQRKHGDIDPATTLRDQVLFS